MSAYERRLAIRKYIETEYASTNFDKVLSSKKEAEVAEKSKTLVLKIEPVKKPTI